MEKNPEEHDLAEYLLENYRRGVAGQAYLPSSKDQVDSKQATQVLDEMLPEISKYSVMPKLIESLLKEVRK